MDFDITEAEEQEIDFYFDSEDDEFFVENNEQTNESLYYNLANKEQYVNSLNQTTNPIKKFDDNHTDFFDKDDLPELFDPEDREQVEFNEFDSAKTRSKKFKESLLNFSDVENNFFYAVIYGIMHKKLNGMNVALDNVKKTLGEKLFFDLKEIELSVKSDHSGFVFFDKCQITNEVLSNYSYFLRFYERRNKFRYQIN